MGQVLDAIDDELQTFLENQHVFFVGTAHWTPMATSTSRRKAGSAASG
jgi:hypothetical protein